ncbi:cbb3-type cytochrome oxidase assembly protein CcoS [Undibacterium luofuense]
MEILYLLIPLALVLAFLIGAVFWWAINSRQFENLEDEGQRILDDKEG